MKEKLQKSRGEDRAEKKKNNAEVEQLEKDKAKLLKKIAMGAVSVFQCCVELVTVIGPNFQLNLLQLGHKVDGDRIVNVKPNGRPVSDADVVYAPPS